MDNNDYFLTILDKASQLPIVKVDRNSFLCKQFTNSKYDVCDIINKGPINAGVSAQELKELAKGVIRFERAQATLISTAAGIPGGVAMIGTVSIDVVQYMGYLIRAAQKLMYLYGIEDISNISDNSKSPIIIALAVMLCSEGTNNALRTLCKNCAVHLETKGAEKTLAKTAVFKLAEKLCKKLSIDITKKNFAKMVSKTIPIVGGVTSGGLTYVTFGASCNHLLKALEREMFPKRNKRNKLENEVPNSDVESKEAVGVTIIE